ncbi:Retrovirus-related Pol polyprotein from transposon 17.6 [Senna tora]|uniref:Retrovirus-related Pol polyprotein from transposon 17.6 n=1 Tax=Senna tora TaxID=362788 RepID=A0A834T2B1_9FABA|nr:Retrovirus-related Pol polyprotein from transposon 17.6 [Senna tora]
MPTVIEDRSCRDEQIENMIHDAFGYHPSNERVNPVEEVVPPSNQTTNDNLKELHELMRDGEQKLYDGCDKDNVV